jgi:shikimate kinase/3-dehydroquinate synthase
LKPATAPDLASATSTPARLNPLSIVLFGPPGSGKSAVGLELSRRLGRDLVDTDQAVTARAGQSPASLINQQGEPALRDLERQICADLEGRAGLVVACGGGTLLDERNRLALGASGVVVFLDGDSATLQRRIAESGDRPLVSMNGLSGLEDLLAARRQVYGAFPLRVDTTGVDVAQAADRVLEALRGGALFRRQIEERTTYPVCLGHACLDLFTGQWLAAERPGRLVVVSDSNVAGPHAAPLAETLGAPLIRFPAGEASKSLGNARALYDAFLEHGLDRRSTVVAVGGGVVGDLVGFAAATFMRGIQWVAAPTSVLAMVDASLGGKVGVNLPQAKNLVGAFHPPSGVWADLDTLDTLPERQFRSGMAEIVKAAVVGDPELFRWMETGSPEPTQRWFERAVEVKAKIVERDPDDFGRRQVLNFGHTLGHALESASRYALSHGEAISIGMVMESRIAERMGVAEQELSLRLTGVLSRMGLPTHPAAVDLERVMRALERDKKRAGGKVRFALPRRIGDVQPGLTVPEGAWSVEMSMLKEAE